MAEDFEIGGPLPEESSNRTFIIAVIGLGSLLILSMICLAVYALVLAPGQEQARATRAALINIENTAVAQTQTAEAADETPAAEPTDTPLPTATASPTQVVVLPSDTPTPFTTLPTLEPLTATAVAQETLDALAGVTATATALPETGFADEAGAPTLLLLAGLLIGVVFIARGLRTRSTAE